MSMPQLPRAERADGVRDLLATAKWGLRLIWQESAALFVASTAIMAVRGMLPALLALVIKGLIDTVMTVVNDDVAGQALLPWLVAAFVLALIEALSGFSKEYVKSRLADDLDIRAATDLMRHATTLDLAFFENPKNRDLIDRARANSGARVASLVSDCQTAVTMAIQTVTLVGVLIVIEPLVLLVVPPFAIPFLVFQWKLANQRYGEQHIRVTKRRWTNYYSGLVTGPYSIPETRVLGLGPLLLDRFKSLLVEFRDRDRVLHRRNLVSSSVATLLIQVALYGLFARVAFNTVAGAATIGDLAIFTGAAGRLRSAMDQAIRSVTSALEHTLFMGNLKSFMAARPALKSGTSRLTPAAGVSLKIEGVSFTYPGSSREVLSDISLDIRAGETIAIVGENGAGKSTLARLVARLSDPDQGRILIDGVDLRHLSFEDLYSHVSVVFQTFGRYEGTVADNIAFGNWRELLEQPGRVAQVAKDAKVDELVAQLPEGYDTVLGRIFGDVTLSGGQWQQLAVARAFTRDVSLLVLDEPTSNLDARAEFELFSRFKELAADRTTILISHRFSTIAMADRIAVLAEGRIVELGTHDTLMRRGGTYAALYDLHRGLDPQPTT